MEEKLQKGGSNSFFDAIIETTGLKGVVLVSYLTLITLVSAAFGTRSLEGVIPGAFLAILLAGALFYEKEYMGNLDSVGILVLGIVVAYTGMEFFGFLQNAWFPLASAAVLFGAVAYSTVANSHSDIIDFMGNIDLVGLYGSILLVIYSILFLGDQLNFIYTPYFPGFVLVFVGSVLLTSVAYVSKSGAPEATHPGELHHRLISVVRSLETIENEGEREELAQQVRAVAGVLNGIKVPSRVEDSQGHVPIVLPVSNFVMAFGSAGFDNLLERVKEDRVTGYVTDSKENVVLLRNGSPVKYYLRGNNELGFEVEDIKEAEPGAFESGVRVFEATYTLLDAIESVTPAGEIAGEAAYEEGIEETTESGETEQSTEPAETTAEEKRVEEEDEEELAEEETTEDLDEPETGETDVGESEPEHPETEEQPAETDDNVGTEEKEVKEEIKDISMEADVEEEPEIEGEVEDISIDADSIGEGVEFDVGSDSSSQQKPEEPVGPETPDSPGTETEETREEEPVNEGQVDEGSVEDESVEGEEEGVSSAGTENDVEVDTNPEVDREVSRVEREMADAIDDLPDKIRVGENEIDLGKMFGDRTKKTRPGSDESLLPDTIRVGDNEIDVQKMFERTDDMFD